MGLLRKGAWAGLGLGLAAAIGECAFMMIGTLFTRIEMAPLYVAQAGGLVIAALVALGVVAAPLLRLPAGRLWHSLALTAAYAGAHQAVLLDSPIATLPARVGPPFAFVLFWTGMGLARWRPALPGPLGAVLLVATWIAPQVYLRATTPAAEAPSPLADPPRGAPDVVLHHGRQEDRRCGPRIGTSILGVR